MIVSTGMANLPEVAQAVRAISGCGNRRIVLLHCVSRYPAEPSEANLKAMAAMASAFQLPIGYSDHTLGIEVALAAAALGACVIEKHLTLGRGLRGPDHAASCEPEELKALVRGVRTVEAALGHGRKEPAPGEAETALAARKSLIAAQDIPAGSVLRRALVCAKRPGTGLTPALLPRLPTPASRHRSRGAARVAIPGAGAPARYSRGWARDRPSGCGTAIRRAVRARAARHRGIDPCRRDYRLQSGLRLDARVHLG